MVESMMSETAPNSRDDARQKIVSLSAQLTPDEMEDLTDLVEQALLDDLNGASEEGSPK
jgi:hypothetical protein